MNSPILSAPAGLALTPSPGDGQRSIRVLYVEDNPADVQLLKELLLEVTFCRVDLIHSELLAQALHLLSSSTFDVILLDLLLPDSQRLDTLMWFRNQRIDIPIVVLSDIEDERIALQAVQDGAQDYLVKGHGDGQTIARCLLYAIERHKMARALMESEARYRNLFDVSERLREFNQGLVGTMAEGVILEDPAGRITFANPKAQEILGCTARDLISQHRSRFVPEAEREFVARQPVYQNRGQACTYETTFRRPDCGEVRVLVSAAPFIQSGEFAGTIVTFVDITERQQAAAALAESEQALRRSSAQLRAMTEAMTAFLEDGDWTRASRRLLQAALEQAESAFGFVGAVVPGPELRILAHAGLETTDFTGIDLDQSLGANWTTAGYLAFTNFDNLFGRVITERTSIVSNDPANDPRSGGLPPGHPPITSFLGVPILWGANVVGLLGVANRPDGYTEEERIRLEVLATMAGVLFDNYRRVQSQAELEQQLRQAQKMEAIGRLAGGIAHDFNNLMTVVTGYTDLLLTRLPDPDPLRGDLLEIKKAGERATSLVYQLLAFSRKQISEPAVLDLNAVIVDLERMLRRLIGEDIELSIAPGSQLGRIEADRVQIEQIIMNLVLNARDAMPQGGKLTIETTNVEMDARETRARFPMLTGSFVALSISDTGHGIERQHLDRIFEPFFTTKERGQGSGLGLSTVYGIVKQNGGEVWVYSEPGQGATFKIYLPRILQPDEERPPVAPVNASRRETVLLVEDEDGVRGLAQRILEQNGYRVLEAAGGEQALRIAGQHPGDIDLVLTDVVMPGMSGPELTRRLAMLRPNIRILFMSGYSDDAIVRHGILEQEASFIGKPFAPDALARRIRGIVDAPEPANRPVEKGD